MDIGVEETDKIRNVLMRTKENIFGVKPNIKSHKQMAGQVF